MKFTKEINIALVSILGLVVLFFGLQFLKGLNLFSNDHTIYVAFSDATGLSASSPVYANGYRVGVVKSLDYDYDPHGKIVAEADRDLEPETVIRRTIQFGIANYPELDTEGQWRRFCQHMDEKYSVNGYIRLWIQGSENERNLNALRSLIAEPQKMRVVFDRILAEEKA